ncbi:hypothetical protein H4582DRAFT_522636 [Lactarius indigo]|nr:hypothetical protein H4582DRAFT_522636 [Lactarius indigo]
MSGGFMAFERLRCLSLTFEGGAPFPGNLRVERDTSPCIGHADGDIVVHGDLHFPPDRPSFPRVCITLRESMVLGALDCDEFYCVKVSFKLLLGEAVKKVEHVDCQYYVIGNGLSPPPWAVVAFCPSLLRRFYFTDGRRVRSYVAIIDVRAPAQPAHTADEPSHTQLRSTTPTTTTTRAINKTTIAARQFTSLPIYLESFDSY